MSINLHNFNFLYRLCIIYSIVLYRWLHTNEDKFIFNHFIQCYRAFHNNWHDLKMIFIYNNQYWISALVSYFLRHFAVTFTLKLREALSSQIIESVSCAENSCNWISLIGKWTIQVHWKDSDMGITLHSRLTINLFLFLERTISLRMKIMLWNAVKKNKIN